MYVWKNFLVSVLSNLNMDEKKIYEDIGFKIKIVIQVPKADTIFGKSVKKMSCRGSRTWNRGEKTDLYMY